MVDRMLDVINKKILAYKEKGMDPSGISDGEHTFKELYEEIKKLKGDLEKGKEVTTDKVTKEPKTEE